MKLGITRTQIPRLVDRLINYLGGILVGIGIGLFLAVEQVPEEGRTIFHLRYFLTAGALITLGSLLLGVVANLLQRLLEKWNPAPPLAMK